MIPKFPPGHVTTSAAARLHRADRGLQCEKSSCRCFGDGFIIWEGRLHSSQLTSEKKPPFSGSNEALAIPVVVLRLR
jgi:hypothetical protein